MAVVDEAFCFVSLLRTDLQRTMEKALASERAGSGEFDFTSDASLGRLLQQRRGDTCTSPRVSDARYLLAVEVQVHKYKCEYRNKYVICVSTYCATPSILEKECKRCLRYVSSEIHIC